MNFLITPGYLLVAFFITLPLFATNPEITLKAVNDTQQISHFSNQDLDMVDFSAEYENIDFSNLDEKTFKYRAELRKRAAFLLTGVIVYQTVRIIGHAGVWISVVAVIVGGASTGGIPGAGAAYLGAMSMVPSAAATVESTSLALGVAASWIPGLP